jgi:formamidopyrimidine-DNA glycosylase
LDTSALSRLGPEPLDPGFTLQRFRQSLQRSRQAIKVRLLDQATVAGIGNIYASESLFRARIHPARQADQLHPTDVASLRRALRRVLREAIAQGSTLPLNWTGQGTQDRLFYYGRHPETSGHYEERLRVYDRANQPCPRCRTLLCRLVQAARGTFFCPACQRH